jgi:hypothetical protein
MAWALVLRRFLLKHFLSQLIKYLRAPTFALLLGLLYVSGCAIPKPLASKRELDKLTQRHGLGHLYYIGTEAGFHHFATKYLGEATKFYTLPGAEYSLQNTFPKTNDKSRWVPYLFNWNRNSKGFRGEPLEVLQATNTTGVSRGGAK